MMHNHDFPTAGTCGFNPRHSAYGDHGVRMRGAEMLARNVLKYQRRKDSRAASRNQADLVALIGAAPYPALATAQLARRLSRKDCLALHFARSVIDLAHPVVA